MSNFALQKQNPGLSLVRQAREESPGSIGQPTSENGSRWRQRTQVEENNRPPRGGKGEKVV